MVVDCTKSHHNQIVGVKCGDRMGYFLGLIIIKPFRLLSTTWIGKIINEYWCHIRMAAYLCSCGGRFSSDVSVADVLRIIHLHLFHWVRSDLQRFWELYNGKGPITTTSVQMESSCLAIYFICILCCGIVVISKSTTVRLKPCTIDELGPGSWPWLLLCLDYGRGSQFGSSLWFHKSCS